MKKVTAFIGTARKKHTYDATVSFLENVKKLGGVEYEVTALTDYQIGACRGCKLCFQKGEEFCPLKDDRDLLLEKMMASDGVVFATPNYSYQVSGTMKMFLDRLGFICHRPRYFGKVFTSIVAQGIYGGNKINKYLNFLAYSTGFDTVKGSCHTAFEPMTGKDRAEMEALMERHSRRFHRRLMGPNPPPPTVLAVMAFRMARTSMKNTLDEGSADYRYYRDRGWLESGFYYPARLGPHLKAAGLLGEYIANRKWPPTTEGA